MFVYVLGSGSLSTKVRYGSQTVVSQTINLCFAGVTLTCNPGKDRDMPKRKREVKYNCQFVL